MEKRRRILPPLGVFVFLAAAGPAAGQSAPGGLVSGQAFLEMPAGERRAYVQGLADQLTYLADSALERGLAWFPACAHRLGAAALETALIRHLKTRPEDLDEPAARSFMWSTAERCFPGRSE